MIKFETYLVDCNWYFLKNKIEVNRKFQVHLM